MHLLIVAATPFEIAPLEGYLSKNFQEIKPGQYLKNNLKITLLITGVGMTLTAYSLGKMLAQVSFDLVINAGIAGAFDRRVKLGSVVQVISDQFGDLGVEEADGSFTDIHELGLLESMAPPFQGGKLVHPIAQEITFLPSAKGLTVNKVHGCQKSIEAIRNKYDADIETMEGAAFFLVCKMEGVQFLGIRAISNHIEPRNKDNWNLALAIQNLNAVLTELINNLQPADSKQYS